MSSLKDWYRYVDSKARSLPEEAAAPERDRSAAGREGDPLSVEPGAASEGTEGSAESATVEEEVVRMGSEPAVGEEGLDVWGGLFPQPRKPEPKPTTAPLRRPAARLDEVPVDLLFARTPLDSPPPPRFDLPEGEVEIPRFDEFVSPYTAEAMPLSLTPSPLAEAPQVAPEPPPMESAEAVSLEDAPPEASLPAELDPVATGISPADALPPATAEPRERAAESGVWGGEDIEGEEGQLRWRSPFRLPGPGRTVFSGAPSPRPEPVTPRPLSSLTSAVEQTLEEVAAAAPTLPRPTPGTEAWERERVERLARTFRETLRALEESRGAPRVAPTPPAVAETEPPHPAPGIETRGEGLTGAPAGTRDRLPAQPASSFERWADLPASRDETALRPADEPAGEPASDRAAVVESPNEPAAAALNVAMPSPPPPPLITATVSEPVASTPTVAELPSLTDAPPLAGAGTQAVDADGEAWHDRLPMAPVSAPEVVDAPVATDEWVEDLPIRPAPRRPVAALPRLPLSAATPDVLRNIEEAALIRQRLPQHMAMLLRIPTNEVAQHSYKSPFRETREDLIGRLLDPQLTLEEAARILGVCPTTVRRYTNRGMLHCHRTPGNQRRFRMSDVLQFLEQYGDRIDRAAEAKQMEAAA